MEVAMVLLKNKQFKWEELCLNYMQRSSNQVVMPYVVA